tara:strand:+ start:6411 stop:6587 length:177 start_codon:yes stop_codon:yes gene_type:complete
MIKVNLGLTGILILLILTSYNTYLTYYFVNSVYEKMELVTSMLEDLDNDIHVIEEKLE